MPKAQTTGNDAGGFDAFFAAIGGQESGGDYSAVNGRTGASGKYQIMPGNIGPWSRQYLGYTVTVSEFRNNPKLQEELARAVLYSYYTKYGARGAAAAWYSGKPGRESDYHRFRSNEPSVGEYVDQVLGRIGGGGAATTTPPTGTGDTQTVSQATGLAGLSRQKPGNAFGAASLGPGLTGGATDPFASEQGDPFGASRSGDPFGAQQQASAANKALASVKPMPGESATDFRDRVIASAMKMLGVPYVWGGTGAKGVDCSGLIKLIYGKLGFNVPRISADQANSGKRVDINSLKAGDLVAWDNSSRNNGADHIAIYAGDGYIIEAPHAGATVRKRKLGKDEGAWGVSLDLPGDF